MRVYKHTLFKVTPKGERAAASISEFKKMYDFGEDPKYLKDRFERYGNVLSLLIQGEKTGDEMLGGYFSNKAYGKHSFPFIIFKILIDGGTSNPSQG